MGSGMCGKCGGNAMKELPVSPRIVVGCIKFDNHWCRCKEKPEDIDKVKAFRAKLAKSQKGGK